jgi:hypothetical protein
MDLKYITLVQWAMAANHEVGFHSSCLCRAALALRENTKRLSGLVLTPAVVAAWVRHESTPGVKAEWQAGSAQVENYGKTIPAVADGITGIFSSVVTGMWTAFEVLATDLWTGSINVQPKKLATLSGNPKRIGKLSGASPEKRKALGEDGGTFGDPQASNKELLLRDIERVSEGTYDLSEKMGDLLRTRFRFTSLRGIRRAYSAAFSEKVKEARTAIEMIDKTLADKALDALSVIRNVIVHSGGVADRDYLNDSKGIPLAPRLRLEQTLALDGELCATVIDATIVCCRRLLSAVDTWIVAVGGDDHKQRIPSDDNPTEYE